MQKAKAEATRASESATQSFLSKKKAPTHLRFTISFWSENVPQIIHDIKQPTLGPPDPGEVLLEIGYYGKMATTLPAADNFEEISF